MDIFNLRNNILPSITGRGRGVGLLLLFCLLCGACDQVSEAERLIYVEPAIAPVDTTDSAGIENLFYQNVLIEDFTGQSCVNCPRATSKINELQEAYGHSRVIAVGIYSGSFGRSKKGVLYPLTTVVGDEYFAHWQLSSQPIGLVNRQSPSDYADWSTQVYTLFQQKARVGIASNAQYDSESREIKIQVDAYTKESAIEGKLQVWLTEDSITDFQYMPDGTNNREYVHNHVFRAAVNGTWGTDFNLAAEGSNSETFTFTIPEDKNWKPQNMHAVSFVYSGNGVEQVAECGILILEKQY